MQKSWQAKPAVFKCNSKGDQGKRASGRWTTISHSDVSEFDTLEEYKADVTQEATRRRKKQTLRAKKEDAVVEKIIENATHGDSGRHGRDSGRADDGRVRTDDCRCRV